MAKELAFNKALTAFIAPPIGGIILRPELPGESG
jgi:hypothetical protein